MAFKYTTRLAKTFDTYQRRNLMPAMTHEAFVSSDSYDEPTYSAPTTINGLLQYRTRQIFDSSGRLVTSEGSIGLGSSPVINEADRIKLANVSIGRILQISKQYDGDGALLTQEIFF